MSTLIMILSGLGLFGALAWLALYVNLALHRDQAVFLADLPAESPRDGWPKLAVVFAARDEAGMVEAATRSILAQDYPRLEVIAVDDRSTDGTGTILDTIAKREDRLRVVHVETLPGGWLGKTHALQLASDATDARWILFTDGDVIFAPGTLRKAVMFAEEQGIDHVTVGPEIPTESVGERIFLALFGLLFSMGAPFDRVADMRRKAHAGIGAFNLVRLQAFRDIGGFSHLALSVDDDMKLGQALKYAGYQPRFLLGRGTVSVRWQVGLGGMIRGLEKNFFAAAGFHLAKVAVATLFLAAIGIAPFLGLFLGPIWARIVCGLGIATIAATLSGSSRQSGIAWYYAFAIPFASVALMITLGRSVVLTLARDGVRWRGHHYPLSELKRHVRLRDAWTREVWRSTR
jgi:glycosyltransferase involved in cell wall biosynthesis